MITLEEEQDNQAIELAITLIKIEDINDMKVIERATKIAIPDLLELEYKMRLQRAYEEYVERAYTIQPTKERAKLIQERWRVIKELELDIYASKL